MSAILSYLPGLSPTGDAEVKHDASFAPNQLERIAERPIERAYVGL